VTKWFFGERMPAPTKEGTGDEPSLAASGRLTVPVSLSARPFWEFPRPYGLEERAKAERPGVIHFRGRGRRRHTRRQLASRRFDILC
jgi:hypothetical protein